MIPTRNFQDKITYYFGAGASANAIPMVGQINERIDDFDRFLTDCLNNISNQIFKIDSKDDFKHFHDHCSRWISLVKQSPSIDTLAKRLFDQNNTSDYDNYKLFLTVLFNYFHYSRIEYKPLVSTLRVPVYNHLLEGRYENLIRSVNQFDQLKSKASIPKNFSFITWNYDFQLELTAFNDIPTKPDLSAAVIEKWNLLNLPLINLNGSSLIPKRLIEKTDFGAFAVIKLLLNIFEDLNSGREPNPLRFSWEEGKDEKIRMLNQLAEDAKYVVVIGYSFPSFNRDVDNAFFHNLRTDSVVFTQVYDYNDSFRIMRYLKQTFKDEHPHFEIRPVESPFFYVPAEYYLEHRVNTLTGFGSI